MGKYGNADGILSFKRSAVVLVCGSCQHQRISDRSAWETFLIRDRSCPEKDNAFQQQQNDARRYIPFTEFDVVQLRIGIMDDVQTISMNCAVLS